ncbi:MAG: hypothetical protein K2J14_01010, partial [Treponemataceae bacterium]|nr:hypothetical protein [Treponemataceae bacterium]
MRRFVLCAGTLCLLALLAPALSPLQRLFDSLVQIAVFYPDVDSTRAAFALAASGDGFSAAAESFEDDEVPPNIAEELLGQLDNRADPGIDGSDSIAAAQFTDSGGRLRRLVYEDEHFSVRAQDGGRTVTDSADGLIVRRHFDGDDRLTAQERFRIGAASRDLTLLSARTYAYHDGATLPYQMTEEITEGGRHTVTDYDENGFAVRREFSHYEQPDSDGTEHADAQHRLVQDKKIVWGYDDARRLVAEETTTYSYGKTATDRETVETDVAKKFYAYDGLGGTKPDISYFENEKLRMRTVYESENVYNETRYFDGGFMVQVRYENGSKVREIVSVD